MSVKILDEVLVAMANGEWGKRRYRGGRGGRNGNGDGDGDGNGDEDGDEDDGVRSQP